MTDRIIDPSWLAPSPVKRLNTRSQDKAYQSLQKICSADDTASPNVVDMSLSTPATGTTLFEAAQRPLSSDRKTSQTILPVTSTFSSPTRGFVSSPGRREVTIAELRTLYRQQSFNARLVLHALKRRLKYAREDHALSLCRDPLSDRVFLDSLLKDESTLNGIETTFFSVTCRYTAILKDEFYVGFWDAWQNICRMAWARCIDRCYLDMVQTVEDARHQLFASAASKKTPEVSFSPRKLADWDETLSSIDQSDLYATSSLCSSTWGSDDFTPHRNNGTFDDFLPDDDEVRRKVMSRICQVTASTPSRCSKNGHQRYSSDASAVEARNCTEQMLGMEESKPSVTHDAAGRPCHDSAGRADARTIRQSLSDDSDISSRPSTVMSGRRSTSCVLMSNCSDFADSVLEQRARKGTSTSDDTRYSSMRRIVKHAFTRDDKIYPLAPLKSTETWYAEYPRTERKPTRSKTNTRTSCGISRRHVTSSDHFKKWLVHNQNSGPQALSAVQTKSEQQTRSRPRTRRPSILSAAQPRFVLD